MTKLRISRDAKRQQVFSIKEYDLILLLETMYDALGNLICPNSHHCDFEGEMDGAGDNVFPECSECSNPDFHDFADCWTKACSIKVIANEGFWEFLEKNKNYIEERVESCKAHGWNNSDMVSRLTAYKEIMEEYKKIGE